MACLHWQPKPRPILRPMKLSTVRNGFGLSLDIYSAQFVQFYTLLYDSILPVSVSVWDSASVNTPLCWLISQLVFVHSERLSHQCKNSIYQYQPQPHEFFQVKNKKWSTTLLHPKGYSSSWASSLNSSSGKPTNWGKFRAIINMSKLYISSHDNTISWSASASPNTWKCNGPFHSSIHFNPGKG